MDRETELASAEWIARLLPPDAHHHTRIVADHWLAMHPAPGTLPGRQHFDVLDLPPAVWPNLGLTEVLAGEPFDLRYRVIGTAVVEHLGEDATGRTVRQRNVGFADRSVEQVLSHYRTVVEERRPDYAGFPLLVRKKGYHVKAERIHLPLAANGRDVDMILTSVVQLGPVRAGGKDG